MKERAPSRTAGETVCWRSHYGKRWDCVQAKLLPSCLTLRILWTVARQALLSMGFSQQEYWSGLPCPPPGDLPNPRIKPASLTSPALAGGFFITSTRLFQKLKTELPHDPATPLLGTYLEKTNSKRYMHPKCSQQHYLQ